jgi:hypothetical protein
MGENPFYVTGNVTVTTGRKTVITNVAFLDNGVRLVDIVNCLSANGFGTFSYLTNIGTEIITDFSDHYQYCNIVCYNKAKPVL